MKRNVKNLLFALAICLTTLTFMAEQAGAVYADTVLVQWYKQYNLNTGTSSTYGHTYKNISYVNGYTYKQTQTDVTTWYDYMAGYNITKYNRVYSTY